MYSNKTKVKKKRTLSNFRQNKNNNILRIFCLVTLNFIKSLLRLYFYFIAAICHLTADFMAQASLEKVWAVSVSLLVKNKKNTQN